MAWTLATIPIYVESDDLSVEANYSLQEVLDATESVVSYFGNPSDKRTLEFVLVLDDTSAGWTTLAAAVKADSAVNLTSDVGSEGNYRIQRLTRRRVHATNHTLPVYRCSADLISV